MEPEASLGQEGAAGLRARDIQILRFIFEGKSNKEIAALMSFSHGTVRVYVSHILARLGVANRSAAAFTALGLGLLGPIEIAPTAGAEVGVPAPALPPVFLSRGNA